MLILIVGETSSGKSEIAKMLTQEYGYLELTSCTTRPIRINEINGKDYFFKSKNDFSVLIQNGELLEYAEYGGNYYGTLKASALKAATSEKPYVLVIEPIGMHSIERFIPKEKLLKVYVEANIGVRMIRYIERIGINEFTVKDAEMLNSRIIDDDIRFKTIRNEVDHIVNNSNMVSPDKVQSTTALLASDINEVVKNKFSLSYSKNEDQEIDREI